MTVIRMYPKRSTRKKKLRGRLYRRHLFVSLMISSPFNQLVYSHLLNMENDHLSNLHSYLTENSNIYCKVCKSIGNKSGKLLTLISDRFLIENPTMLSIDRELMRMRRSIKLTDEFSKYILKLILNGRLKYKFKDVGNNGEFKASSYDGMTEFRMRLKLDGNYVAPTLFYHKDSDSFTYGFIPWSSEDRGYKVFLDVTRRFLNSSPIKSGWSKPVCCNWGFSGDDMYNSLSKNSNPSLVYDEDFKIDYPIDEINKYLSRVVKILKLW